ncbi:MAG: hypothetical protein IPO21_00720 [Bacteroidales bacterium]|nr:hypothetical protein [Bacteroidales bacterium]
MKLLAAIFFTLIVSVSFGEPYIAIQRIWIKDSVEFFGIHGFIVNVKISRKQFVDIQDAYVYFKLRKKNNDVIVEKRSSIHSDTVSVFFPYYMTKLDSGYQEVKVILDPRYRVKNVTEEKPLTYTGRIDFMFTFMQPKIYKIQLKIDALKVLQVRDFENISKPDLQYKIYYSAKKHKGYFMYESNIISDSIEAGWDAYSSTLSITENDIFSVYVEDKDFDNEISKYIFTCKSFLLNHEQLSLLQNDEISHIKFSYRLIN